MLQLPSLALESWLLEQAESNEALVVEGPLGATRGIFSPAEDWMEEVGGVPRRLAEVLARVFPVPLPPYGLNYI